MSSCQKGGLPVIFWGFVTKMFGNPSFTKHGTLRELRSKGLWEHRNDSVIKYVISYADFLKTIGCYLNLIYDGLSLVNVEKNEFK